MENISETSTAYSSLSDETENLQRNSIGFKIEIFISVLFAIFATFANSIVLFNIITQKLHNST